MSTKAGSVWVGGTPVEKTSVRDLINELANLTEHEYAITNGSGAFPVRDLSNVLGGGVALYLPRSFVHQRDGVLRQFTVANAESSELPGFAKIALAGSSVSAVWMDFADNTYKVDSYSGSALTLPIANRDETVLVYAGWGRVHGCIWPVRDVDDVERPVVEFRDALVVEVGELLVPAFYKKGFDVTSWSLHSPASGAYEALTLSTVNTEVRAHVWDSISDELRTIAGAAAGMHGGHTRHVIARSLAGNVSSIYPMIGKVPGGAAPNACIFSAGDRSDDMPLKSGSQTATDVTDSDLIAAGFTRGWTAAAGAGVFVGQRFAAPVGGQRVFFRVRIETDTADDFGSPRVFVWADTALTQTILLSQEKKYSSGAAIYSATAILDAEDDIAFFYAGSAPTGGATTLIVTGVQFGLGEAARWVLRDDHPIALPAGEYAAGQTSAALEGRIDEPTPWGFAYPSQMFLAADRELPLYPSNCMPQRVEPLSFQAVFESLCGASEGYYPYAVTGRDELRLSGARVGAAGAITLRRAGASAALRDHRWRRDVTLHVAPASQVATANVLMIGDSLTQYAGGAERVSRKLTALGVTPTMIGTVPCSGVSGVDNNDDAGVLCEGRAGWEFSDYTFENSDVAIPVASGDEAAYLALDAFGKRQRNPFLKTPTASDSSDKPTFIKNGYIFDFAFYLSRFSLSTPDYVIVNLGTNDATQQTPSETLAQVQEGFEILYNQIREAAPSAHIIFATTAIGRTVFGDGRWETDRYDTLIVELMSLVQAERDGGDAAVWFLPAYAHMSDLTGWSQDSPVADGTGLIDYSISDNVHFIDAGREQYAELQAIAVAALQAGA